MLQAKYLKRYVRFYLIIQYPDPAIFLKIEPADLIINSRNNKKAADNRGFLQLVIQNYSPPLNSTFQCLVQ